MKNAFYLDDSNNIVSSDKATHVVLQELDDDGNLIEETFGFTNSTFDSKKYNQIDGEISPKVQALLDDVTDKKGNHVFRK